MSRQMNKEKPEVYALRQDGENWQITRRDFLKVAGVGAAALGDIGMHFPDTDPQYKGISSVILLPPFLHHN